MIPREPITIVQAAVMDPMRRDLYVEGDHDRLVLDFLCQGVRDSGVRILPADSAIHLSRAHGGAKARLLFLAELAEKHDVNNLRFLVDRDFDPFIGKKCPRNTWQTDTPDMEGYLLATATLSKILRISFGAGTKDAEALFSDIIDICRQLGILRVVSLRKDMNLPISNTKKSKAIARKGRTVAFDFDRFVTAVLQEAHISLSERDSVLAEYRQIKKEFHTTPSLQLVRGKDFMDVGTIVFRRMSLETRELSRILWAALDRSIVQHFQSLAQVVAYLSNGI